MGDLHRAIMPSHALTLCVLIGLVALHGVVCTIKVTPANGHPAVGSKVMVTVSGQLPTGWTVAGCEENKADAALAKKEGKSRGACPRVKFGDVYAQHVAVLDTANGLQLNVITPVVGYGMKGEDADVDVTVELPSIDTPGAMVPHSEAKAWKWLCDCETDCEVPRDSTFYSGTNSCESVGGMSAPPGDNCCVASSGALFKCAAGTDCCNGFCCPPNSACQTCGGVAQCSAPIL